MESPQVLRQSKSIKHCFEKNANTFKDFYSDLTGKQWESCQLHLTILTIIKRSSITWLYRKTVVTLNYATLKTMKKILACWDTSKAPGLNLISS